MRHMKRVTTDGVHSPEGLGRGSGHSHLADGRVDLADRSLIIWRGLAGMAVGRVIKAVALRAWRRPQESDGVHSVAGWDGPTG